jgi:hypothetical protein
MNERHYALVIGINDYPDAPDSYRLNGAVNDAKNVERWLLDENGGGLMKEHCFTLYVDPEDQQGELEGYPDRYHIDKTLKSIRSQLKKKYKASEETAERFYFYFSGHGQSMRLEDDNILMCMASWGPDAPNANLSSRLLIKDFLERCLPCEELVFWTDCCRLRATDIRAGFLEQGCRTPWKKGFQPKLFWAGATLHDTPAGEALDDKQKNSGYFTRALIEGLKSGKGDKGISWSGLSDYLKSRVEQIAHQDNFPQRAEVRYKDEGEQLYFGNLCEGSNLTIKLKGMNRNIELFFNAVESKKKWSNVSGNIVYENLELGLYKLVDLDDENSRLIDCSSPEEVTIDDF